MNRHRYEVYVGNIGRVHVGENRRVALSRFIAYKKSSRLSSGPAAGEDDDD